MSKWLESGRTMVETLAVFSVISVLAILVVYAYSHATKTIKADAISRQMALYVQEYRHKFMGNSDNLTQKIKIIHGIVLQIRNGTGTRKDYFSVNSLLLDKDLCEKILESQFITPITKEFSGENASCPGEVTLWFSKMPDDTGPLPAEQEIPEPQDPCKDVSCGLGASCVDGNCQCQSADTTYDAYREKCIPVCNDETQRTCDNATDVWCCASNLICGSNGSCGCESRSDCGENYNGYCNASKECIACGNDEEYDVLRGKCVPTCNSNNQKGCSNETDVWCCSVGLACGRNSSECLCETIDDCGANFNGYCDRIIGRCVECNDNQYIEGTNCIDKCLTDKDCKNATCVDGHCVSSCASNKYRDEGGTCRGCDDGTRYKPLSEYECQKCNITGKRVYYVDGNGLCQRSHCEKLKFESETSCQLCGSLATATPKNARECFFCDAFLASNGKCQPCSINAAIAAEEVSCNMCNETDFPREYADGKCVPACLSTQISCHNTAETNFWCCPEGTECTPEDENVKCKVTSTEGKCRYQFSVTAGNGPYDVIMDDDYVCPDGQYCFGKWDSTGNFVTGWVGDKKDKYLYGVCINMNHSIDSPTKDALNPWIGSN